VLIDDLIETEELGAIAVLGQVLMAVTALVAIVTNRIAIVGVMTSGPHCHLERGAFHPDTGRHHLG
jgi:hypothetical protein